jgi:nitroreductase
MAHRRSMGLARLSDDPVDLHLIEQMLEAANWAPSHDETEPWRFVVFAGKGREELADLFETASRSTAKPETLEQELAGARKRAFAAPVWFAIGMEPLVDDSGTPKMPLDEEMMAVACAVQNLHLMASTLGLAGMWHSKGLSIDPIVAKGLEWTAPSRLLGFFVCGWPNCDWAKGERRPWHEKVRWFIDPT